MFERTKLLIQDEGFNKLVDSTVLIVGVGGVGGIAVESLARSGVGRIIIVDNDTIDITNLNRQVQTNTNNIGLSKVNEMIRHIKSINPDIDIIGHELFYSLDCNHIFDNVDFVIDAIDTLSSKIDLIETCLNKGIPFVSSLGMGNRLDPSKVLVTTLNKTEYDPLAKVLRKLARDRRLDLRKIKVVFSTEIPITQSKVINDSKIIRKQKMPPASMFLVPPTAGLNCAAYCVDYLINSK